MGVLIATLLVGQIISPGDLSRAHAELDNAASCTKCHSSGKRLAAQTCLTCHKELNTRVEKKKGFHATVTEPCQSCHHEHQGREFPVVDWKPKDFKHASVGFVLKGKHSKVECAGCHKLVVDEDVKAYLAAHPKATTFLGLGTVCKDCHKDPHEGALKGECQSCHQETAWHELKGFDHARTDFALAGKHATLACNECHAGSEHLNPTLLKPLPHESCTDCHKDTHNGRFGAQCKSCHSEAGWNVLARSTDRAFHEKTRFPLIGEHREVACSACHGPFGKDKPHKLTGLAFSSCASCHVDAHAGQLKAQPCESCHRFEGFKPADYRMSEHKAFPLDGSHAAVGCSECHTNAARPKPVVPKGKVFHASTFEFHPAHAGCDSCHSDVHKGQFASKKCETCHTTQAFAALRFEHDATKFPLTGGHVGVACASCHREGRYAATPTACGSCHRDAHAGQLGAQCSRCHTTAAFKTLSFDHSAVFPLDGKHEKVACEKCHPRVEVKGKKVQRFVPTARECEGCHQDPHKGAFKRFVK